MSYYTQLEAIGIKSNEPKKRYAHKFTLYSKELDEKMPVVAFTNNKSRDQTVNKYSERQKKRNDAYDKKQQLKEHRSEPKIESIPKVLSSEIHRTTFKLILNPGTDTTTTALIGSSFSAGKTTIMMNAIVPFFYGNKRKYANDMWKPTKQKKILSQVDNKDKLYINTIFSLNTHIKAYKGYTDLIKVTGFEREQQTMVDKMREIQVKTDNKYRFAIFVDDILDVRHSKMIDNMYLTLRNCEISTTMCLQYLYLLSKRVRNNVQNLILCKLLSDEAIEDVIKTYLKSFFTKMGVKPQDHVNLYKELTSDFNFIHIHQGSNQIYFCKAVNLH